MASSRFSAECFFVKGMGAGHGKHYKEKGKIKSKKICIPSLTSGNPLSNGGPMDGSFVRKMDRAEAEGKAVFDIIVVFEAARTVIVVAPSGVNQFSDWHAVFFGLHYLVKRNIYFQCNLLKRRFSRMAEDFGGPLQGFPSGVSGSRQEELHRFYRPRSLVQYLRQ